MRDYPESYHPVTTCFSCKHSEQLDGIHMSDCKKHDVLVALWCLCDDFEEKVYDYDTVNGV